jgi:hypothetical protein
MKYAIFHGKNQIKSFDLLKGSNLRKKEIQYQGQWVQMRMGSKDWTRGFRDRWVQRIGLEGSDFGLSPSEESKERKAREDQQ